LRTLLLLFLMLGQAVAGTSPQQGSNRPKPTPHTAALAANDSDAGTLAALAAGGAAGDRAQEQWEAGNQKLTAAQEEYAAFSLRHAEDAYRWQHFSTQVIFCVVILLMIAGIVFSWIQFRQGMHHPAQAIALSSSKVTSTGDTVPAADVTIQKDAVTEFSASPQGIKVASSTLGVIILVISMCFFYMYLRYVYPISIENANRAVTDVQKTTGK
jgi:hypothetical protein